MTSVTVQVNLEELDADFLKKIRALFKNGRVRVTFESEEVPALEQISTVLARRVREGAAYSLSGAAFDDLLQAAEADEQFEVVSALKKHKKQPHAQR